VAGRSERNQEVGRKELTLPSKKPLLANREINLHGGFTHVVWKSVDINGR